MIKSTAGTCTANPPPILLSPGNFRSLEQERLWKLSWPVLDTSNCSSLAEGYNYKSPSTQTFPLIIQTRFLSLPELGASGGFHGEGYFLQGPAIFADYFVMYLNLQSCAISVLLLHEQGREMQPNSHSGAAKGLCPGWFWGSRCCFCAVPWFYCAFKENPRAGGRGEASPAVHQHKEAAQTSGNVPWGKVISLLLFPVLNFTWSQFVFQLTAWLSPIL